MSSIELNSTFHWGCYRYVVYIAPLQSTRRRCTDVSYDATQQLLLEVEVVASFRRQHSTPDWQAKLTHNHPMISSLKFVGVTGCPWRAAV